MLKPKSSNMTIACSCLHAQVSNCTYTPSTTSSKPTLGIAHSMLQETAVWSGFNKNHCYQQDTNLALALLHYSQQVAYQAMLAYWTWWLMVYMCNLTPVRANSCRQWSCCLIWVLTFSAFCGVSWLGNI